MVNIVVGIVVIIDVGIVVNIVVGIVVIIVVGIVVIIVEGGIYSHWSVVMLYSQQLYAFELFIMINDWHT